MAFKKEDVGSKMVDGVAVRHSDAEAKVIAAEWDANMVVTQDKKNRADVREARISALHGRMDDGSATDAEVREYLSITT